jgi:hypothetical protein
MAWYYGMAGKEMGPVAEAELLRLIHDGTLTAESPVWCTGMPQWAPIKLTQWAKEVPGLARPGASGLPLVQALSPNQLVTSIEARAVLEPIRQCFLELALPNVQVDTAMLRVSSTNGATRIKLIAQVTRDERGTIVTVKFTPPGGDSEQLTNRLIDALTASLQSANQGAMQGGIQECPPALYPDSQDPMPTMKGNTILTLALLGIFCCVPLGVAAWIRGGKALEEYGDKDPGDRDLLVVASYIGLVSTVIWCCILIFVLASVLFR